MAKDIAQRELDQSRFRICRLGTPTEPGDATFVDRATIPLPNAGTGNPGTSFHAAAADHIHPAAPGQGPAPIIRSSPNLQSALQLDTDQHEILFEDRLDFGTFGGAHVVSVTLTADLCRHGVSDGGPGGRLIVVTDAEDNDPNTGMYSATVHSDSDTLATLSHTVDIPVPQPTSLVRILATGGVLAKNKTITFALKE